MNPIHRITFVALVGGFLSGSELHAAGIPKDLGITYETLSPGIGYGTVEIDDPPTFIHVVRADLEDPAVQVGPVFAKGRQSVTDMARGATTAERDVVALINGDYFDESAGRGAWGPHIQNGELILSPLKRKSAFMMTSEGQPLIDIPKMDMKATFVEGRVSLDILDVNRHDKLDKAGYHLLTPRAEVTRFDVKNASVLVLKGGPLRVGRDVSATVTRIAEEGQSATIPPDGFLLYCSEKQSFKPQQMKVGAKMVLRMEVTPACRDLIGGGPAMVKNGGNRIDFLKEEFSPSHLAYLNNGLHPRSAVGHSRDKRYVYLVVVEGRIERSQGMEVKGLGQAMMALGCHEAMEFDGGGSSTLFTKDGMSSTADTQFRAVANGLAVFRAVEESSIEEPDLSLEEDVELEDDAEKIVTPKPVKKKPSSSSQDRIDQLIDEVLSE